MKKVEKPWGYEIWFAHTDKYVGKVIHVNANQKLSLQYHEVKDETIYLSSGVLDLLLENEEGILETHRMLPGESRHILPFRKHRMIAVEDCDIFEVSTPEVEDVVRLEDAYGRANK